MDAVLCLTTVATRLGDRCGLLAFDRSVRAVLPARAGRDQLGRVAEAMFDLEPVLAESDYRGALHASPRPLPPALVDRPLHRPRRAAVGESLLPALPLLVRHHIVLVAAVRDPDVVRWATAPPGDVGDAYRAAAATMALEERDRASARLRGLAPSSSTNPPTSSPRASPTPTSTSKHEVVCERRCSPAASFSEPGEASAATLNARCSGHGGAGPSRVVGSGGASLRHA